MPQVGNTSHGYGQLRAGAATSGERETSTSLATAVLTDLSNLQALIRELVSKTRKIADDIVGAKPNSPKGEDPNPPIPANGLLEGFRAEIHIATKLGQVLYEELNRIDSKL